MPNPRIRRVHRLVARGAVRLAAATLLLALVGWGLLLLGSTAGRALAGEAPAEAPAATEEGADPPAEAAAAGPAAAPLPADPSADPEAWAADQEAPPPPEPDAPALDLSYLAERYLGRWVLIELLGVAVWQFLAAFLFILLGLVMRKVSDVVWDHTLIPLLKKTPFKFDHMMGEAASKPIGWALALAGLAGAAAVMRLPVDPNVRGFAYGALKVLVALDIVWFLFRAVDVVVYQLMQAAERTDSRLDDQIVPLLRKSLKVTIGAFSAVWVVQLLGYNVASLLAGLGIGGLAVALALQDTLANFFGSVFIFLDHPFRVGDLVKINDAEGTVEQIGFRSTRVRLFGRSVVAIPNKHVADAAIDNWSARNMRRVVQTVGVTYSTTADQMEALVADIRGILEADEGVDNEWIAVRFTEFGGSSLNLTVIYFTVSPDYLDYLDSMERVNLAVMRALVARDLEIAFPTRTIHVASGKMAEE